MVFPKGHTTGPRKRTRLRLLGSVTAGVALVMVVLAISGSGSRTGDGAGHQMGTLGSIRSLLGGIRERGDVLGSATAPVTLAYFGDLECPFCREFTLGALPSIIRRWVRTGQLRIEYRSMETATHEPEVFKTQQVAALAAGRQNKMWYFIELFYHEQGEEDSGYVTESYLQGLAEQVPGLNLVQWMSDRNDLKLAARVEADKHLAERLHFPGTPTLLFGKSGGQATRYNPPSLTDAAGFNKVIEKLLRT